MSGVDPAMTLMQAALGRIAGGDIAGAGADLEQAAALHAQAGRSYDEARCLQLAASLKRMGGDGAEAAGLMQRAAALDVRDLPLAVSIAAEAAEEAHSAGRWEEALERWTRCLATARTAGLRPDGMIALHDRRSQAALELDRPDEAEEDLERACAIADEAVAWRLRAQHASRLIDRGSAERAARLLPPDGQAIADPMARAMLAVQQARLARQSGALDRARSWASEARSAAREAIAPLPYFTGSVELAEICDEAGDRSAAYAALTSCWATLSDLLGRETARSWIEPCLLALQLRWGDAAFAAVKQAHDEARKHARQGPPHDA
jgi:hypothetical protein